MGWWDKNTMWQLDKRWKIERTRWNPRLKDAVEEDDSETCAGFHVPCLPSSSQGFILLVLPFAWIVVCNKKENSKRIEENTKNSNFTPIPQFPKV